MRKPAASEPLTPSGNPTSHTLFFLLLSLVSVILSVSSSMNVATWGTAVQSTLYDQHWYAKYALDGSSNICSCTLWQTDPWWKLDLMKTYSVNRVTITNRPDCCESRINGAEIRIGKVSSNVSSNPVCAVVSTIPAGATYSYSCHGMEGRYVTVNIPGTSRILTLCEVGVYVIFPGNLATGRNVTQSSTFGSWTTQQATDFNPGFIQPSSACSSTNVQTNPWWRVDLRYIYRVSRVIITNRLDCCPEQINGAEIHIGNSLDNNGNNNPICAVISSIPAGVSSTYICNDMEGRYVNLIIPGDSRILTLCEVEVYGEGPLLKKTFLKMKLKSSSSLSEPICLFQLQSALVQRGFSDMMLQWSQPPKQEVMRKEAELQSKC
uniref:Fucolectin tachylectin-4 pentraxin-1 domain-containing protein n=1 Tax=Cyprinus carpio carpio TaxID=630221 RepID=A0A8C1E258_CYPCA